MQMNELLPCPFCGGEAETLTAESMHGGYLFGIMCNDCRSRGDVYDTEAEAIAAWNSRAPIEYDGWFYLPKPKEGIVDYGEPAITRTENGYKVRQIVDVVDEAARKWGDDLGEYIMRRICEVWNSRAERTCKVISHRTFCGAGGCEEAGELWTLSCGHEVMNDSDYPPNFCDECGCKVVGE